VSSSVCFGDNTIDRYLEPIGLDLIGGSCLNVAVGIVRHGVAAAYVGPVGDDEAGARVLAELAAQRVDGAQVAVLPDSATAVTEILSLPDGDRQFVSESYEIFETYEPDSAAWASVIAATHVHTSSLPHLFDRLRDAAANRGFRFSCDFSTSELPADLDGLDLAFRSAGESTDAEHGLKLAAEALERGAALAVVTLGVGGSVAVTAGQSIQQDAFRVASVVDTCGAGDAFIAAYLERWLAGATIERSLVAGAKAGARACETLGAFPQRSAAKSVP
jgi:fructoselysine 6-kinase